MCSPTRQISQSKELFIRTLSEHVHCRALLRLQFSRHVKTYPHIESSVFAVLFVENPSPRASNVIKVAPGLCMSSANSVSARRALLWESLGTFSVTSTEFVESAAVLRLVCDCVDKALFLSTRIGLEFNTSYTDWTVIGCFP